MGGPQGRGSSRGLGLYRYRDTSKNDWRTKVHVSKNKIRETILVPTICMPRTRMNLQRRTYGDCDELGQKKRVARQREYEEM
jgi:hypothetical protein